MEQTLQANYREAESQQNNERQPQYSNCSSKIWTQVVSSKVKEVRQVIQIGEQKTSTNTSPVIQRNQDLMPNDDVQIKKNLVIIPLQKPITSDQDKSKSVTKQKDEVISKDLFLSTSPCTIMYKSFKQNQAIYKQFMVKYEKGIHEANSKVSRQRQHLAIQILNQKIKESQIKQKNILNVVDLLYKKYLLKPKKDFINEKTIDYSPFNIYSIEPTFAQNFASYRDTPSKSDTFSFSQDSDFNPYKRQYVGGRYAGQDQQQISLLQGDSTNDLQTIANNYINTIRKVQRIDGVQKPKFGTIPKQPSMMDKTKRFQSQFAPQPVAPLQVKMPSNAVVSRQFQPYNVLQSTDQQKSQRFNQQRLIAKTFVKDGYGLQIVRNYLGPNIQGGSYNRAVTTIIRQSYKKIEQFLSKQCNIKIHNLTSSEFSLVKTPLVHCRNILREEDLRTFFKFIAITYNFGKLKESEYPTAQNALNLYNAILRGLNDRKVAKQGSTKGSGQNPKQMFFKR